MHKATAIVVLVLTGGLAFSGTGAASPRLPAGTEVFKGPMDPYGSIRFQALPSKRGKTPRLDRFIFKFDCGDGLGPTGGSYGAAAGSSIRPNAKGRFRILDENPRFTFALSGDFNRRYTKASGTFRMQGDLGDTVHVDCDTGKLSWTATLKSQE